MSIEEIKERVGAYAGRPACERKTTSKYDDQGHDVTRCVEVYENGIRVVSKIYAGESWTRWIIVPRDVVIAQVRADKAKERRDVARCLKVFPEAGRKPMTYPNWTGLHPAECAAAPWTCGQYYGGPGRPFCHGGGLMKRDSGRAGKRRFYVICESGGLDI